MVLAVLQSWVKSLLSRPQTSQSQAKAKFQWLGSLYSKCLKRRSPIRVLREGSVYVSLYQEGRLWRWQLYFSGRGAKHLYELHSFPWESVHLWVLSATCLEIYTLWNLGSRSCSRKSSPKWMFKSGKDHDRLLSSILSCVHCTFQTQVTPQKIICL